MTIADVLSDLTFVKSRTSPSLNCSNKTLNLRCVRFSFLTSTLVRSLILMRESYYPTKASGQLFYIYHVSYYKIRRC
jgi:hypothetical protein